MFFPYRDENRSRRFPVLTLALIALNVHIFLNTYTAESFEATVIHLGYTPPALLSRPYILITSIFLHSGWLHLISNMWFLWLFGDNIEDQFGRLRFLGLYLFAGVVGNFTHTFFTGFDSAAPVIGASGAVAGIMGSYFIQFPLARVRCVLFIIFYPIFFRLRALWLLGFWMALEFYQALSASPGDYVAHWAHIGGFLIGALWTVGQRSSRWLKN